MPFVRIDLLKGSTPEYRQGVSDVIYEAMVATLNVPANDRFQVFTEHEQTLQFVDPTYLGIERSAQCLLIQVTLNAGRTLEMKRAFYVAVANGLHERLGQRKEDVFISLVEVPKENWSFGNGVAQYAT